LGDYPLDFKRIVIVTDAWEPQVSGVVTTLKKMVEFAKRDGYDIVIVHPELFKRKFYSKLYPEIPFAVPFGISKYLKYKTDTVYHIATEGPLGLAAAFILTAKNRRYTTSYHTDWSKFMKDVAGVPEWITRSYLKWFHRKRKVFCPTETVKQYMIDNEIGRRQIIWPRGVDPKIFTARIKPHLRSTKTLLSVGRVSKEKNLDAFCQLTDKYKKIVVGDGPYKEELERKYPNVIFVGYKFGAELANYYRQADCFVFTSKADTFGVVMIEAMYCGTPVAAYPVQGPIDVVDNKYTGILDENIELAIEKCLTLSRKKCNIIARDSWSWEVVWNIFVNNLEKDK
jgi:glycosyltransferase involved in cell wall biosynthesis